MIVHVTRIHKNRLLLLLMLVCSGFFLYANETEQWIVAASEFQSNKENDSLSQVIPLYILQNIPQEMKRSVSSQEQFRIDEKEINSQMRSVYEDLQSTQLERDSLIITSSDESNYANVQKDLESEIDSLLQDIHEYENEKMLLSQKNFGTVEKLIVPWNDTVDDLYSVPENEVFFNPSDINALVSGSITHADSFISVSVYITLYPGKVIELELKEVDSALSIQNMLQRVSEKINTFLSNKEEVEIHFMIEPSEIQAQSSIHIYGNILKFDDEQEYASIKVPAGIHEFYVESPGYEGLAVTYSFTNQKTFSVTIQPKAKSVQNVSFSIPSQNGELFINTQKMIQNQADQEETTQGIVTVNGLPALGEYVNDAGVKTWFLLQGAQENFLSESTAKQTYSFEPNTKNLGEIIEKNRKRMYNSYAALIVSLPLYFIANGQYLNEYNSWASGKSDGEHLSSWTTARYVTMGVSIGLGINFLVQLGLYIHSANAILPEEVEITK